MGRVLVRLITTVVLAVALPRLRDTPLICTLPLVGFTLVCSTQHRVFIRAIMAVLVAVAQEMWTGAVSIIALKLAEPAVASWAGGRLV